MGKNITAVVEEYDKILNERIDKGLENLRKYKETRAEAIKITTAKLGSWPYLYNSPNEAERSKSNPEIKTIGDLFGYVFHNPEGGEKWEPSVMRDGYAAVGDYFSDINGKNSGDKTIGDRYKVLSDTYIKSPKYLEAIKKKGGGQYWFDFIMYFMYKLMKKQGPWEKAAVGPSWPGEKTKSPEKKVSDLATLKDFEDYVWDESEFLSNADIESFTTYKGLSDLANTFSPKSKFIHPAVLEAGDEYIGKYTAEIDKRYTEKGDYYLIAYLDIEPDPEPKPEIPVTSTVGLTQSTKKVDAEFVFNVEKTGVFLCKDNTIGELTIIKKEIQESPTTDSAFPLENPDEPLSDEYTEEEYAGAEEQNNVFEMLQNNSLEDPSPSAESAARIDDANIDPNSYVGEKWKSFDIEAAISKINKTAHKCDSKFKESLKKVLTYIKNDSSVDDVRKAAYLLGTAYVESGYSLQRWEADYLQSGTGIPYPEIKKVGNNITGGPNQKILDYYRSKKGGKKDYYSLGTDTYGLPYFGRGLIQLTGKENYQAYGKKIQQDLLGNGDLALQPQNSYKIAIEYMKSRTFAHVLKNDLTKARKSINGGVKGIEEVNGAYSDWLSILKETQNIA
jgi:predicted chitinase